MPSCPAVLGKKPGAGVPHCRDPYPRVPRSVQGLGPSAKGAHGSVIPGLCTARRRPCSPILIHKCSMPTSPFRALR